MSKPAVKHKLEPSPLKLKGPYKRQRTDLDYSKCIICQKVTKDAVSTATEKGKKTFITRLREKLQVDDADATDLYYYINDIIQDDDGEWSFKSGVTIVWHREHYSAFTNLSNMVEKATKSTESFMHLERLHRTEFLWKELCMFCGHKTHKHVHETIMVSTFEFCTNLEDEVKRQNDDVMRCKVGGDFMKLIALEARYHKMCRRDYFNQVKKTNSNASQSFTPYN